MLPVRLAFIASLATVAACGSDSALSDYFPKLPPVTHDPQAVFAGEVTDPSQLVTGPAQSGLVGDFYMQNDRVTFIIQAPTRVIGVVPQGGNVVDAVLTDEEIAGIQQLEQLPQIQNVIAKYLEGASALAPVAN